MNAAVLSAGAGTVSGRRDLQRRRIRRFMRHRLAVVSAIVLAVLILAAACAPAVERLLGADIRNVDLTALLQGPSLAHPLGSIPEPRSDRSMSPLGRLEVTPGGLAPSTLRFADRLGGC